MTNATGPKENWYEDVRFPRGVNDDCHVLLDSKIVLRLYFHGIL